MAKSKRKNYNQNPKNNRPKNNVESDKQIADNLESKLENLTVNNEVTPDEITLTDIKEVDNSNPTYKSAKELYHNALQI